MADNRVRIAKDKVDLLKRLAPAPDKSGHAPFKSYAAAVSFAAAYGAMNNVSSPITIKSSVIEPIRSHIFRNQNLYSLIELLAVYRYEDPIVLASSSDAEGKRISAFEEYANGGFELLMKTCEGSVDVLDAIVLLIRKIEQGDDETDIGSISNILI